MLLNIDAGARVLFVKAKRPNLGAVMGDMFGSSPTADMPIMHQGHATKTGAYVAPFVERHKVLLAQPARAAPPAPPVWVAPPVPSARVAPPAEPGQLTDDEIGRLVNWRIQGGMNGPMNARMQALWDRASEAQRLSVDHAAGLTDPPRKPAPSEVPEEGPDYSNPWTPRPFTNADGSSGYEFRVPGPLLGGLRERVEQFARKSRKLKGSAPRLELVGTPVMEQLQSSAQGRDNEIFNADVTVPVQTVRLVSEPIRIPGWTVIGALDHKNGIAGRPIVMDLADKVPAKYRESKGTCDHCNTKRERGMTFLLRNPEGELKEIGKTCLKDYTGHDPSDLVAQFDAMTWIFGLAASMANARDMDEWGPDMMGSRGDPASVFTPQSWLQRSATFIRLYGFHKSGGEEKSTWEDVLDSKYSREAEDAYRDNVTIGDKQTAEAVRDWLLSLPDDEPSNFLANAKAIMSSGEMNRRTGAILSACVWVWIKDQRKKAEESAEAAGGPEFKPKPAGERAHVGTVGKRQDFAVKLIGRHEYERPAYGYGDSGIGYLHRFATEDGNVLLWFASSQNFETRKSTQSNPGSGEFRPMPIGHVMKIKATPKAHEKDRKDGGAVTIISRVAPNFGSLTPEGLEASDAEYKKQWSERLNKSASPMILFFKAQRKGASAVMGDLFGDPAPTPKATKEVMHAGYTDKEGHFHQPHVQRHEVNIEQAPAKADAGPKRLTELGGFKVGQRVMWQQGSSTSGEPPAAQEVEIRQLYVATGAKKAIVVGPSGREFSTGLGRLKAVPAPAEAKHEPKALVAPAPSETAAPIMFAFVDAMKDVAAIYARDDASFGEQNMFGSAGGARVPILNDFGKEEAYRLVSDGRVKLKIQHISAMERLSAAGGTSDYLTTDKSYASALSQVANASLGTDSRAIAAAGLSGDNAKWSELRDADRLVVVDDRPGIKTRFRLTPNGAALVSAAHKAEEAILAEREFATRPPAAPAPAPARPPATHTSSTGEPLWATPEPGIYTDADGAEVEDEYARPVKAAMPHVFPASPARTAESKIPSNPQFAPIPYADGKTAKVIRAWGRPMVVADINGVRVPFYVSTGMGGKAGVPAGKWYPFFGFGPADMSPSHWFNKGHEDDILDYYGSDELRKVAWKLDTHLGNVINDPSIPDVEAGPHIAAINAGLGIKPVTLYDPRGFEANVADVLARIRGPKEGATKPEAEREPARPHIFPADAPMDVAAFADQETAKYPDMAAAAARESDHFETAADLPHIFPADAAKPVREDYDTAAEHLEAVKAWRRATGNYNAHEARREDRADRLDDAAIAANRRANAANKRGHDIAGRFEFGQPILVGHHSEKRARADRARMDSAMRRTIEESDKAKDLAMRADAARSNKAVSSDDEDAVEKLAAKLEAMEADQSRMKAINAAHKRFLKDPATLDAAPLSESDKLRVRSYKPRYSWEPHPVAPFEMQNNNANIRRVRERVADLRAKRAAAEAGPEPDREFDGGRIVHNTEANRLQILFTHKPDAEARAKLKANGFRWSPAERAWQRQLGPQAKWAAEQALGLNLTKSLRQWGVLGL